MVRCTRCRFLFESMTPGLLPACVQCGGDTMLVIGMSPSPEGDSEDSWPPQPTAKFRITKAASR